MLALLAFGMVGLFFCFVPGLDAPNYHGSFLLTLFSGVVGGLTGVMSGHKAATDVRGPARLAVKRVLLPALLPLILLLFNGLRVRQCDVGLGIAFYLIGPLFTALWAAAVGAWIGAAFARKRIGLLVFGLLWLAWVGHEVHHILTQPAIFAYNPFGGYFAGNIYDTVIPLDDRYLAYRLANLMQIGFFAALFAAGWDPRASRWSWSRLARGSTPRLALTIATLTGVVAFWQARAPLGHEIDRDDIEEALGGRLEDDSLVLIWPRGQMSEAEALLAFEDHRYRLASLAKILGAPFPRRITSYIYPDEATKRRLMGAGRVYLAKPWLDEIHLNRVSYGEPVVLHELAHVVLGVYAPNPLRIPTRLCIVPQMALVEGAAEALEWDAGTLTPHQWTATLRQLGLAPALDKLLGPTGFYAQASGLAYTIAGSFIRWLIDTEGIVAFQRLYADGDFEAAYERPLEALITDWTAFIDREIVPHEAAEVAAARFTKRAIFFEVCGLDVARTESDAHAASAKGDYAAAGAAWGQVVAWVPEDAEKRLPLIELASRRMDLAAVRMAAAAYFRLPDRLVLSDARVLEWLADTHLRLGDHVAAAALYPLAAAYPMESDRLRNLAVKAAVASAPIGSARAGLSDYLMRSDVAALAAAATDPLGAYLKGRRESLQGKREPAIAALQQAITQLAPQKDATGRLAWEPLAYVESVRLLGLSQFFAGQLIEARATFTLFVALTPHAGHREAYNDWIRRIDWRLSDARP